MDLRVAAAFAMVLFLCGCSVSENGGEGDYIDTGELIGKEVTVPETEPKIPEKTNEEILEEMGCGDIAMSVKGNECFANYIRRTGDKSKCSWIQSGFFKEYAGCYNSTG